MEEDEGGPLCGAFMCDDVPGCAPPPNAGRSSCTCRARMGTTSEPDEKESLPNCTTGSENTGPVTEKGNGAPSALVVL